MYVSDKPDLSTVKPAKKCPISGQSTIEFERCVEITKDKSCICEPTHVCAGVYYIDDVLTEFECDALCNQISMSNDLSFWSDGDQSKEEYRMFRNAQTIEIHTTVLANRIWERVQSVLGDLSIMVEDNESDVNYERELVGHWEPSALNYDMLFAQYPSMGSFAPHTDGRTIHDFNTRSFYSVIIFLNDIPRGCGGGTRFYESGAVKNLTQIKVDGNSMWSADPSLVFAEVDAVRGRMLVFHQALVHEGVPPTAPYMKNIIRSDIMMRRGPPICDSETDREAYIIFRQAEEFAEAGDVQTSVQLFKKAFKLSPLMASVMGQA